MIPSKEPDYLASCEFSDWAFAEAASGYRLHDHTDAALHASGRYDALYDVCRFEDWKTIKAAVLSNTAETVNVLLSAAKRNAREVALWLVSENHRRLYDAVCGHLQIPSEKSFPVIAKFGNTLSAMLPLQLACAEEEGRIKRGDLILMRSLGEGIHGGGTLIRF